MFFVGRDWVKYKINHNSSCSIESFKVSDFNLLPLICYESIYGDLNSNPGKIDINYSLDNPPGGNFFDGGDIMHANGLDYDPLNDVIYLSVNYFDEIWVIDHSTTTEEAQSNSGGNYNKGGDLIYRFGNPTTYNSLGNKLFDKNHFPNFLPFHPQKIR